MSITGNLTDFLSVNEDVILISDTEGYLSMGIGKKIDEHPGKIVFLGDMGDYTIGRGLSIETDDKTKKNRFCFLKYIQKIVEKPDKYVAVLGNRDLNKLNLWQLVQFNDGKKWWTDEDNVTVENNDIIAIAIKLINKIKNKSKNTTSGNQPVNNNPTNNNPTNNNPANNKPANNKPANNKPAVDWLVNDLSDFAPYWNFHISSSKEWYGWDKEKYNTLWGRYEAIFAVDPSKGTMSAPNMADGLITELGLTLPSSENENELKAAIVFTVFARLLDRSLSKWKYDGVLHKFLTTNPLIGRADIKDKIYLFSHGGVHSNFNQEIINLLKGQYDNITQSIIENNPKQFKQNGGADINFSNLQYFNHSVVYSIERFYNELDEFFKSKTQTNQLDLSKKQHPLLRSLVGIACSIGNNQIFGNKSYHFQSPIMTGIFDIKNDSTPIEQNANIYNILGHAPSGFSYSFLIGNNGQRIINCDFSNSLLKAEQSSLYDENNAILYFNPNDGTFKLDGTINVNGLNKQKPYNIGKNVTSTDLIIDSKNNNFFNNYIDKERLEIKFTRDKHIEFSFVNMYNMKYTDSSNQVIAYHGKVDILHKKKNYQFYMFSYSDRSFNKQLILNENKIEQIIGLINKKNLPQLTNSSNLPQYVPVRGTGEGFTAYAPLYNGGGHAKRKNKQRKTKKNRKSVNKKRTRKH